MNRPPHLAQRLADDKWHTLHGSWLRHRVGHQGLAKSGTAFFGRLIEALRNGRNQSQLISDAQVDLSGFQGLSLGFNNRSPHLKVNTWKRQGEECPIP